MVGLDSFAVAAEFLARQILSVMMVPLFSAEEKTSVGGDGFPEKKGTGWSGRVVEPCAVATSEDSDASMIYALRVWPTFAAQEKS